MDDQSSTDQPEDPNDAFLDEHGAAVSDWNPEWPDPDPRTISADGKADDYALEKYKSMLAHQAKLADAHLAVAEARRELDDSRATTFWTNLTTIAAGVVERSRANADIVQKASAAVATLYTGALGLVFTASDHPLPVRGILPVLFLGLAVVLATYYLAYQSPTIGPASTVDTDRPTADAEAAARFNTIVTYTHNLVTPRVMALRCSVVALAVGLAFLPLAFLAPPSFAVAAAPANTGTKTGDTELIDWPSAEGLPPGRLGAIRYQAEVDETAALRKAQREDEQAPAAENDLGYTLALLVLGLLLVYVVPRRIPAETTTVSPGMPGSGGAA